MARWDNPEGRFWGLVRKGEGCWEWAGGCFPDGYGRFTLRGYRTATHRISYELSVGPITEGLYVCHHCDNKLCVRPDHLFLGTQVDNMQDWTRKGKNKLISDPALLPRGDNHWTRRTAGASGRISALRKQEWASGRRVAIRDERGRIMGTRMVGSDAA